MSTHSNTPNKLTQSDKYLPYFLAIFDHCTDIIVLLDNDGCIIEINSAGEEYYHCNRAEVIGKKHVTLCHSDEAQLITSTQTKMLSADDIEWSSITPQNSDETTHGLIIFGKKNVYKIKTEQKKTLLQDYLKDIAARMPGNFYWKDREGHYLGCNKALLNTLGFASEKNIIGKTDYELWPKQADELRSNDMFVMQSGKLMHVEEEVELTNPYRKAYFTVVKMPLFDKNGHISGIIGNSLDITPIKDTQINLKKAKEIAEKEIKNTSQYLQDIISSIPGSIYWKNKDGVYLGCNEFMVKTAGMNSINDIVSKTDAELWSEQAQALRVHDHAVMTSGNAMKIEESVLLPNGEKKFFTVVKMPLRDSDKTIGIIGNSLEITELKKTQEALEEARNQAEASDRAKSEFIANMSHDVKTPLAGMIGLAEVLNKKLTDTQNRELVRMIYHSGNQLLHFFENCLEMVKLEAGEVSLVKEDFSTESVVQELMELFEPAIKNKGLGFHMNYDPLIPEYVHGSRAGLYRIILNLLGNAIKFTHKGSATISLALDKKSTKKKSIIVLTVEDTGIGIPDDKQASIFERFSRVIPSYHGKFEGHGIGLYIVKKFATEMGGQVAIRSKLNKGSCFIITLPFVKAMNAFDQKQPVKQPIAIQVVIPTPTEKTITTAAPMASPAATTSFPAGTPKLLLVEDNLMAQTVAKMLLASLGYQVEVADRGSKVLDLFEPGKYDLIFMDIGLPDMEGTMLTQHLRKMEKGSQSHTPIVALSAHAISKVQITCLEAGMNDVLSKPLSEQKAKATIAKYVHGVESTLHSTNTPAETTNTTELAIIDEGADKSLLDLFVQSLPESKADIDHAYSIHDLQSLRQAIHKLHGALCYTHTPHFKQAVSQLETSLSKGETEQVDELYQHVMQAMQQFEEKYQEL